MTQLSCVGGIPQTTQPKNLKYNLQLVGYISFATAPENPLVPSQLVMLTWALVAGVNDKVYGGREPPFHFYYLFA